MMTISSPKLETELISDLTKLHETCLKSVIFNTPISHVALSLKREIRRVDLR